MRLTLALLALPLFVHADVRLHPLFSDHAVLQSGKSVAVWGWADVEEEVTVSIANQSVKAKTGADGKWKVQLEPMEYTKSLSLTVEGKNKLIVNDVLIGEVWLGSGQSNMAMSVGRSQDFEKEKAAATNSLIRMFTVSGDTVSASPLDTCEGSWVVVSPETVERMSATLYFAGRDLAGRLHVPVGLINSSTGGTAIESWIDAKAQEATPALAPFLKAVREVKVDEVAGNAEHEKKMAEWQEAVKVARKEGKEIPRRPRNAVETMKRKLDIGGRFNGKIAPLVGYTIRGMVWYQGEANAQPDKAGYYEHQMPLLVEDWRKKWGDEFPVILVQLPNFGRGEPWVIVREAVRKTVMKMQDVGIVVTIDVGDPKDVHPKNKQAVGRRVAGWALDRVYSQGLVGESPLVNGATVQGIEVTLRFDNGKRMELKGEGGFELCDSKGNWRPAHAQAVNEIVVVHSDISNPVGVRYAWKDDPAVTLWSAEGLPASPFMLMIGEHEK